MKGLGGFSGFINCLFHFLYPPVELIFGALACVTILLLEQADNLFCIAARLFQVIIGDLPPPFFNLAAHFLPLAFENIFIHDVILFIFRESYPLLANHPITTPVESHSLK
jgi:hypothetical protein